MTKYHSLSGFVFGFVFGSCLVSCPVHVWVSIWVHGSWVGSCLVVFGFRVRFVSGFMFGSCLGSCLSSCLVRVRFVPGSCLFRVRFVFGFIFCSRLFRSRVRFVSCLDLCLVHIWIRIWVRDRISCLGSGS